MMDFLMAALLAILMVGHLDKRKAALLDKGQVEPTEPRLAVLLEYLTADSKD